MGHKQTLMAMATKFPSFQIVPNIQDDEDVFSMFIVQEPWFVVPQKH